MFDINSVGVLIWSSSHGMRERLIVMSRSDERLVASKNFKQAFNLYISNIMFCFDYYLKLNKYIDDLSISFEIINLSNNMELHIIPT